MRLLPSWPPALPLGLSFSQATTTEAPVQPSSPIVESLTHLWLLWSFLEMVGLGESREALLLTQVPEDPPHSSLSALQGTS